MPFVPFHTRFSDLAKLETRSITTFNDGDLPEATYGLIELYCNERDCDCRRVLFQVISAEVEWKKETPLATISFGWEDDSFYRDWASFDLSDEDLDELRGPGLMRLVPQSHYAPALLERIRPLLEDKAYVDRLIRHYEMFREAIESGAGGRRKLGMSWTEEKRNQRRRERKKARKKKGRSGKRS
jgi:hypothetical protein